MKRILSLLLTLTLVVTFFALGQAEVEAATSTCTTNQTVFVHYHRWDETYTDSTIHTWGYGTAGSGEGTGVVEEDGFGAVYQICVDDDSDAELGLILKYGADWSGDDFTDRDGLDLDSSGGKDNKSIVVKENDAFVGFTDGVKHVYVLEGSNEVFYGDEHSMPFDDGANMATVAFIYYDPAEDYDNWNLWTWGYGTNGTKADPINGGDTGLLWQGALGVDGGEVANFRVSFLNVDTADMGDELGFIVRTNSWEKKYPENITWSTANLAAGDFVPLFYIAGEATVRETFTDFEETVNFFEIASATALDPNSVEVVFNKDEVTKADDVIIFDDAAFTLVDKDDNPVTISQVSFNSTSDVNNTFTLITETALMGSGSPYEVSYTRGEDVFTKEIVVDSDAPTITILGPTETTLELGDTYSLPNYFATDDVDGESVDIYNVRVKEGHGTVDTRNAGIYPVVIEASDKFGNVAEATITVTVTDPCDDTAHLDANNNVGFIALLVGLPVAFGAIVTLGRKY